MSDEKKSEYYDEIFDSKEIHFRNYKKSPYYVLWTQIIYMLNDRRDEKILEMGCGTGQFAKYLGDEGYENYVGFDFSKKAIEHAKQNNPDKSFFIGDINDGSLYKDSFDTAICLEVLEHLKNDKEIVQNIPEGKRIIISIPTFDSESHVRWFRSERQVKSRYYKWIDIEKLTKVNLWFVLVGERSTFEPSFLQRFLKTREKINFNSFWLRFLFKVKNKFKIKRLI